MTDCPTMSHRMPEVLHGRAFWTEEEVRHLRDCAECAAEWRMLEAAARLGAAEAQRIDPGRIATRVHARVAAARRWKRTVWVGLAAAAAVAVLVWARWQPTPGPERLATTQEFHLPLAELDALDATQLRTILREMDLPLGANAAPEVPGLGDLENQELERVLRSLEG